MWPPTASSTRRCWSSASSFGVAALPFGGDRLRRPTNAAPRLWTCSRTDRDAHRRRTRRRRGRRAVAMAWSPATPAPRMNTFAGASVPAAVVSIGSSLPSRCGAEQHRLDSQPQWPAMTARPSTGRAGDAGHQNSIAIAATAGPGERGEQLRAAGGGRRRRQRGRSPPHRARTAAAGLPATASVPDFEHDVHSTERYVGRGVDEAGAGPLVVSVGQEGARARAALDYDPCPAFARRAEPVSAARCPVRAARPTAPRPPR